MGYGRAGSLRRETQINGDEVKARRVAVSLAQQAQYAEEDSWISRVELECWDCPAEYTEPARLLHTYLVKADGTFEEISGRSHPERVALARGRH